MNVTPPQPLLPASLTAVTGIAKMDLSVPEGGEACVAAIRFPPGWSGGEAVFVQRQRKQGQRKEEEVGDKAR